MTTPLAVSRRSTEFTPHVQAADARHAELHASFVRASDRFIAHPVYTFMHMMPAVLILLLAPFQFSKRIRARHLRFHRWSGRVILVSGIAVAVSAVYFGIVNPHVPGIEPPVIVAITGSFVFAGLRAFIAIRRRDVARHREWMIRMYAVALSIATVRFVDLPLQLGLRDVHLEVLQVTSFWLGWILTLAGAELWIRHTRRVDPTRALRGGTAYDE